ncbi:NlpC/P60-like cell-wall peptidase, putative [Trichophyton verrucosum HKI 0517]|uniref:NlpC/P60-like cell-wall peptidase, putative n=1 Tax=Trichophyton verrucosum (strain HKI 0517) TaxID=663202 RepID=D4DKU9_TRIVH|nr:NlpC/P60-like cell-wall peptidase, putative [Trichophyton verrucosum HKI 0517]EFE37482.1 NlpC/P60-like cell-wall peptidase, putative [Trichophyton verrucosum HKI 0517]
MKLSPVVISLLLSAVSASPARTALLTRTVGSKCTAPEGEGSCQQTSACKGISYSQALCPNDPADVQCCVEHECSTGAGHGFCRSLSNGCPSGRFDKGSGPKWPCPGGDNIQCCIKREDDNHPPPPGDGSIGQKILDKALTAAGVPYAWGGGSCEGPTHDMPPWQNGEIGYDCSGLIGWAVCQVTGRDLFSEGLRVTRSMYCASEEKLRYKKYPFAERKPGDAVFFGGSCDCGNPDTIHHVGLMMYVYPICLHLRRLFSFHYSLTSSRDSGDRMWNAPNDDVNQVQENSISGFGEKPCPDVVRFE